MPKVLMTERGRGSRPDQLKADPTSRVTYHDAGQAGLVVRVTPNGVRTFSAWVRVKGGPVRRVTLGRVEELALADARERAREIRRAARDGRDPVVEARAAAAKAAKEALVGGTFAELATRFLADGRTRRGAPLAPSTLGFYKQILEHDIVPRLGKISPAEVTRAHVRALVDEIRARGRDTLANRVLATVGAVFGWAVARDMVESSPVLGLRQAPERPRERSYADAEIRSLFAAILNAKVGPVVELAFLTAARSGELRSARWSDFDLERRTWTIPNPKEGRPKMLPLSKAAMRTLDRIQPDATKRSGFIFPASTASGYADPPDLDELRQSSGVADFRLHDVRRTVRTRLGAFADSDICERILGHAVGRIQRTYDVGDYVERMRPVLERWAGELERIVSGRRSDVVVRFGR